VKGRRVQTKMRCVTHWGKKEMHSHSLVLGAVQQYHGTLDPLECNVGFRVGVVVHGVQGHHTLQVPAHKAGTWTPLNNTRGAESRQLL